MVRFLENCWEKIKQLQEFVNTFKQLQILNEFAYNLKSPQPIPKKPLSPNCQWVQIDPNWLFYDKIILEP